MYLAKQQHSHTLPLGYKTHRITDMRKAKTKKKTSIAWSKDEVKLLKKLFPRGRVREIAERIGRSLPAVRQKAYYMGIRTTGNRFWSANEVQLLKKLYQDENAQRIADKLGRSLKAVKGKASAIGLKKQGSHPWSRQEIALLKKLYPDNSARDIASRLGRTVLAVQQKASKLGLGKSIRVWSKRELNLLKRLYPSKMAEQIAEQIGRPVQATRKKIVVLGLRKRFRYEDCHRVVNGVEEKLCRKCRKWKGESQFCRNRSSKDGLLGWCRRCLSTVRRKRRLAVKN
jgi:hypothetical protein